MTPEDLLENLNKEFSISKASLLIAKTYDLNNNFDIENYKNEINKMSNELKQKINKEKDPENIISEINNYLFKEKEFGYNGNFFLNKVLDDKKGSCIGLSTLYLSLAEELDLPIYGVNLPQHMIVRWDDDKFKRNIETTIKGSEFPDSFYIKYKNIPKESIEKEVYLRNLSKKEVVGIILNNRGSAYYTKEDLERAIQDYNNAIKLNPKFVEAYFNRGSVYYTKGDLERAIQDYNNAIKLNPKFVEAYFNRGSVYYDKGVKKTVQEYERALHDQNYVNSHNNKGIACHLKGYFKRAIQNYNEAIKLNPNFTEAFKALKSAQEELSSLKVLKDIFYG